MLWKGEPRHLFSYDSCRKWWCFCPWPILLGFCSGSFEWEWQVRKKTDCQQKMGAVFTRALWGWVWARQERKVCGWQGVCVTWIIVWTPPAAAVASSQPGQLGDGLWSGERCTVWSLSNLVYWIGLQRIGAMFPLSPVVLLSACRVNVHLGAQLALGKTCRNFLCAQCVPSGLAEWIMHSGDIWGLVLAEEGLPSLCYTVCQECTPLTVLWPTGKAFMAS